MKILRTILFIQITLVFNKCILSQTFNYISPKDNSEHVSLSTNIILKANENIDALSLSQNQFSVFGTLSGLHSGIVKLSDDDKTILFIPTVPFSANENVNVTINKGIKNINGREMPPVTIQFKTTSLLRPIVSNTITSLEKEPVNSSANSSLVDKSTNKILSASSLPSDFPPITIGTSNNPAPGNIFVTNKSQNTNTSVGYYLMVLNNDGSAAKYKQLSQMDNLFKMEPNGDLSCPAVSGGWLLMDTSLTAIDSFQMGYGYKAEAHDFLLLPNGHSVMFANDAQPIDMSTVVYGGNPNAIVTGIVVQELDASKNVVFQWRSWDYIPLTDSYYDLTSSAVDLIHANALSADTDGNILVSMRHLSSIVKINRETGDVMWILGGKQNQFTFINEHETNAPTYFSYQHGLTMFPNGDLALFDNGTQHSPNYSRGVEYKLDQVNKTAALVWEYRHSPDLYANSMGSVQRLPNGNTVVCWGSAAASTGVPVMTEVASDNSVALELFMGSNQFAYRTYVYPWVSQKPIASVSSSGLLQGNTYQLNNSTDTTGISITFNSISSSGSPAVSVSRYKYSPLSPTFTSTAPVLLSNYFTIKGININSYSGTVNVDLKYYSALLDPGETVVYARSGIGNTFLPLATSYDSVSDQLTFTTSNLGDFAFGVPQVVDSVYSPGLISPSDSAIVNQGTSLSLVWGTKGIVQTYHLQVSTSSSFSTTVTDKSGLTTTSSKLNSLKLNTTYYWRVNNTNSAGTSDWSYVRSFNAAAPFISISSPNGGETLYLDSTYIVRWKSNIADTVNINLMNGTNVASVIGTGIVSKTYAYQWQIPSGLTTGSNYKVTVTSKTNSAYTGSSSSTFSVIVNPLPVELVTFYADLIGSNVDIKWTTATEVNTLRFYVQRMSVTISTNGSWLTVGTINAHMNSSTQNDYSFIDKNREPGKYNYRLKILDKDGSFILSDVINAEVALPGKFELMQNYPNPFNPSTTIKYSIPVNQHVTIIIFDILGGEIEKLVDEEKLAGEYEVKFNTHNLSSGVYLYKLTSGACTQVRKMQLIK